MARSTFRHSSSPNTDSAWTAATLVFMVFSRCAEGWRGASPELYGWKDSITGGELWKGVSLRRTLTKRRKHFSNSPSCQQEIARWRRETCPRAREKRFPEGGGRTVAAGRIAKGCLIGAALALVLSHAPSEGADSRAAEKEGEVVWYSALLLD